MNSIKFKCIYKYTLLVVVTAAVGISGNVCAMQQQSYGAKKTTGIGNCFGAGRRAGANGKLSVNEVIDRATLIEEMLELVKKNPVERIEGLDQISADLLKKAYADYQNKINNTESAVDALRDYVQVIETIIKRLQKINADEKAHAQESVFMSYALAPFVNVYKGFYAQPNIKTALKGVAGLGLYAGIIYGVGSVLWKRILSGQESLGGQEEDEATKAARLAREAEEARIARDEAARLAREQREHDAQEFEQVGVTMQRVIDDQRNAGEMPQIRGFFGEAMRAIDDFTNGRNLEMDYNAAMAGGRQQKIAFIRARYQEIMQAARDFFDAAIQEIRGNRQQEEDWQLAALQAGLAAFDREVLNLNREAAQGVRAETDRLERVFAQAMQQVRNAIEPMMRAVEDERVIRDVLRGIRHGNYQQMREGMEERVGRLFIGAMQQGYNALDALVMPRRPEVPNVVLQAGIRAIVEGVRAHLDNRLQELLRDEGEGQYLEVDRRVALEAGLAVLNREERRLVVRVGQEVRQEAERLVGVFEEIMQQMRNAAEQAALAQVAAERQRDEEEHARREQERLVRLAEVEREAAEEVARRERERLAQVARIEQGRLAQEAARRERAEEVARLERERLAQVARIEQGRLAQEAARRERAEEVARLERAAQLAQVAEAERRAQEDARLVQEAEQRRQAQERARREQERLVRVAGAERQAQENARAAQLAQVAEAERRAQEDARLAQEAIQRRQVQENARLAQEAEQRRQAQEAEQRRLQVQEAARAQEAEQRRQVQEVARALEVERVAEAERQAEAARVEQVRLVRIAARKELEAARALEDAQQEAAQQEAAQQEAARLAQGAVVFGGAVQGEPADVRVPGLMGELNLGRPAHIVVENGVMHWRDVDRHMKDFVLRSRENFTIELANNVPNQTLTPGEPLLGETLILVDIDGTVGLQVRDRQDTTKRLFMPISGRGSAHDIIKKWQDRKAIVLGFTARSHLHLLPGQLGEYQKGNVPSDLKVIGIDYGASANALGLDWNNAGGPGCYNNGVIYTAGTSKGDSLLAFLNSNPELRDRIKRIIFVDDDNRYIGQVEEFLRTEQRYDGLLLQFKGGGHSSALSRIRDEGELARHENRDVDAALRDAMPLHLPAVDPEQVLREIQAFDLQVTEITEAYKKIREEAGQLVPGGMGDENVAGPAPVAPIAQHVAVGAPERVDVAPIEPARRHVADERGVERWSDLNDNIADFIMPNKTLILVDVDLTVGVKAYFGRKNGDGEVEFLIPIQDAPEVIRGWQERGAIVLGLTARTYFGNPARAGAVDPTEGDETLLALQLMGIDYYNNRVADLRLQNFNNLAGVPGLRNASYHRGIIYVGAIVAGHKSLALEKFLEANAGQLSGIERIMFVDDNVDCIRSVKEYLGRTKYDGFVFQFQGGLNKLGQFGNIAAGHIEQNYSQLCNPEAAQLLKAEIAMIMEKFERYLANPALLVQGNHAVNDGDLGRPAQLDPMAPGR